MLNVCMCSRGNVRSVTLAALLKDYGGLEGVVTCGVDTIGDSLYPICYIEPRNLWVVGESDLCGRLTERLTNLKLPLYPMYWIDIGLDIWQSPMHPELMKSIADKLREKNLLPEPRGMYPTIEIYLAANEAAYYRHRRE